MSWVCNMGGGDIRHVLWAVRGLEGLTSRPDKLRNWVLLLMDTVSPSTSKCEKLPWKLLSSALLLISSVATVVRFCTQRKHKDFSIQHCLKPLTNMLRDVRTLSLAGIIAQAQTCKCQEDCKCKNTPNTDSTMCCAASRTSVQQ